MDLQRPAMQQCVPPLVEKHDFLPLLVPIPPVQIQELLLLFHCV
eukprot:Gb_16930 [translate_table: standard]